MKNKPLIFLLFICLVVFFLMKPFGDRGRIQSSGSDNSQTKKTLPKSAGETRSSPETLRKPACKQKFSARKILNEEFADVEEIKDSRTTDDGFLFQDVKLKTGERLSLIYGLCHRSMSLTYSSPENSTKFIEIAIDVMEDKRFFTEIGIMKLSHLREELTRLALQPEKPSYDFKCEEDSDCSITRTNEGFKFDLRSKSTIPTPVQ